jgi:hypothetical protein
VPDALAEPALDVVVDHFGEASEFLLDGLCLPDEHLEQRGPQRAGQNEVVTADLVGRLELAVDAAIALLDAARVPGQVKMEEIRAPARASSCNGRSSENTRLGPRSKAVRSTCHDTCDAVTRMALDTASRSHPALFGIESAPGS